MASASVSNSFFPPIARGTVLNGTPISAIPLGLPFTLTNTSGSTGPIGPTGSPGSGGSSRLSTVAVGVNPSNNHGVIINSTGTDNWSQVLDVTNTQFNGICYAPDIPLYVAVGSTGGNGGIIYTSTDSNSWTLAQITTYILNAVAWSPGLHIFSAVGDTGSVYTSTRGTTWTGPLPINPKPDPAGPLNDIAWSPDLGIFTGVGKNYYVISVDGIKWQSVSSFGGTNFVAIDWSRDLQTYRILGQGGGLTNIGAFNPDPFSGNILSVYVTPTTLNDIVWAHGEQSWIAVGTSGTTGIIIGSSSGDTGTWTIRPGPSGNEDLRAVTYDNLLSRFTAVGSTSTNGSTIISSQTSSSGGSGPTGIVSQWYVASTFLSSGTLPTYSYFDVVSNDSIGWAPPPTEFRPSWFMTSLAPTGTTGPTQIGPPTISVGPTGPTYIFNNLPSMGIGALHITNSSPGWTIAANREITNNNNIIGQTYSLTTTLSLNTQNDSNFGVQVWYGATGNTNLVDNLVASSQFTTLNLGSGKPASVTVVGQLTIAENPIYFDIGIQSAYPSTLTDTINVTNAVMTATRIA